MIFLPLEIIEIIIDFVLDFATYKPLRLVNKTFYNIILQIPPLRYTDYYGKIGWYTPVGFMHGVILNPTNHCESCLKWHSLVISEYDNGLLIRRITIDEINRNFQIDIMTEDERVDICDEDYYIKSSYDPSDLLDLPDRDLYKLFNGFIVRIHKPYISTTRRVLFTEE